MYHVDSKRSWHDARVKTVLFDIFETALFDANASLKRKKDRWIREAVIAQQQVQTLISRLAAAEQISGGNL